MAWTMECDSECGCSKCCVSRPDLTKLTVRTVCLEPIQPERSKREDTDNGPFFPPPWNINEHPEKTEGWIEFQKELRKNPEYYRDAVL